MVKSIKFCTEVNEYKHVGDLCVSHFLHHWNKIPHVKEERFHFVFSFCLMITVHRWKAPRPRGRRRRSDFGGHQEHSTEEGARERNTYPFQVTSLWPGSFEQTPSPSSAFHSELYNTLLMDIMPQNLILQSPTFYCERFLLGLLDLNHSNHCHLLNTGIQEACLKPMLIDIWSIA